MIVIIAVIVVAVLVAIVVVVMMEAVVGMVMATRSDPKWGLPSGLEWQNLSEGRWERALTWNT